MFAVRSYRLQWLRGDIIAGVSVAAICIPESLGYAGIVGLPVQAGLYTALLAPILFAVLASSRQLVVGADSAVALSLADRLRRQYRPDDEVLAIPGAIDFRLTRRLPAGKKMPPDVRVFRYGTSLFFENAANFTDRVNHLIRSLDVPVGLLVLDMAAMSDLDYTGVDTIRRLATDLEQRGTTVVLTEMAPTVGWVVNKSRLQDAVITVPRLEDAVFAARAATP